jgi:hypothetical protein
MTSLAGKGHHLGRRNHLDEPLHQFELTRVLRTGQARRLRLPAAFSKRSAHDMFVPVIAVIAGDFTEKM